MSKSGCGDKELLNYIYENYDELECELNGNECKELKKRNRNLCIDCNMKMTIDYQNSHLVYELWFVRVLSGVCSVIQSYDATIEKKMCIQKVR